MEEWVSANSSFTTDKWQPWFAWYPVRDKHGKIVWLKTIVRRKEWFGSIGEFYGYRWVYGNVFDLLAEKE